MVELTHATDQTATNGYEKNFKVTWILLGTWLMSGSSINIVENGHLVSRRSDFILYSVEAEYVDEVVKTYGPCNSLMNGR